jgi:hypothetical protein
MPRPPILPVLDWREIFYSGTIYTAWLKEAENDEPVRRMERIRGGVFVEPHEEALLAGLTRWVHVVAIAEAWCGDVQRHAPVLQRLADLAPNLEVRYIRREQHPDVLLRFLTNGGEAIPKFVFLSADFVECGNWGPMPHACRELLSKGKACGDIDKARQKVSALYEADSNLRVVVRELLDLVQIAAATEP